MALCIAAPEEGARALGGLELEAYFSSDLLRRAAKHLLAGELGAPMAERAAGEDLHGDPELKALLAELIVEAGGEEANSGMLEVQRLQLELARLERGIQQARGPGRHRRGGFGQAESRAQSGVRPGVCQGCWRRRGRARGSAPQSNALETNSAQRCDIQG